MNTRRDRSGLQVDTVLDDFVAERLAPAAGIDTDSFWRGLAAIAAEFAPRIDDALAKRDRLQSAIDQWHRAHPGSIADIEEYGAFLTSIGYLAPTPLPVQISTEGVDPEIADIAAPQLVVPLTNARFALNAVNARWGSLYDALYGTDAIPGSRAEAGYDASRGAAVIRWGRDFLDDAAPLAGGSHRDVTRYRVDVEGLLADTDAAPLRLADPSRFVGSTGAGDRPTSVILINNDLHIDVRIDPSHRVGMQDGAGVYDIVLEAAATTIVDLEDSVAAVDAADKVVAYDNWLGLMTGSLTTRVTKAGREFTRSIAPDRPFERADGTEGALRARSLLFIRHTGHAMVTDAVLDAGGEPIPEGILDAVVTTAAAIGNLRDRVDGPANSRYGSMYVVKPKMHGPDEVRLTVDLFGAVERMLDLPARTIKLGIMDEERRTTLNLAACIAAAADRVVFINTGFLDRTGDEIHTSSYAGVFPPKAELRSASFISAYETNNVDVGLAAGFRGRAQIGKGMWAMTDLMAAMLEHKGAQLRAGASTAWVPSPTAAVLHATHYHRIDVAAAQRELADRVDTGIRPLLHVPVAASPPSRPVRDRELDTNVQSILGYVVRWVDQGVGCSKVPDLADVALMEDRATLRISSQLLGNWLLHGVIAPADVLSALDRIAPKVDAQNSGDPLYRGLGSSRDPSLAYCAARDLILEASSQPNGYTEPILHGYRARAKAAG